MESLYFVMSWLCHRTCEHCYEDRFRPYYGDDLRRVVEQSRANVPRIIENLPQRLTFLNSADPAAPEKPGKIILAGGEVMLEPIREPVLYPALAQLRHRYPAETGVEIIVQTTGDILTKKKIHELLDLGVNAITVSGMDSFHAGFEEEEARERLKAKLVSWFPEGPGRRLDFFGATPESWIGKLWPRGRAWSNELSQATLPDNFCNGWSGGLRFLEHQYEGSEVSIDPEGNVFPCCMKTKLAVGSLLTHRLEEILDSLRGNPVYEAISQGRPERMGLTLGWSEERFRAKSRTRLASGREYENLCIGCDRFHEEVLMPGGPLVQIGGA